MRKENLRNYHRFLNDEFPIVLKKDTDSEKLFKELFPNEPVSLWKLEAIFEYQKADEVKVVKHEKV